MTCLNSIFKKIPSLIIIGAFGVSMLLVSTAPRPVKAQWAVADGISYIKMALSHATQEVQVYLEGTMQAKEFIGDPYAWALEKSLLDTVSAKMINMVSGGYHDPNTGNVGAMFVTNLSRNLRDNVGTPVALKTVLSMQKGESPFAALAAGQIRYAYFHSTSPLGFWQTNNYTLNRRVYNTHRFLNGDFSQGGVNGFLSMATNPLNNPYGTYFAAQNQLNNRVYNARSARKAELGFGGGFLSQPGTPGSIVKAQLNKALGSGVGSMIAADALGEVVTNMTADLVNRALGGNGGLGGFTSPDSSGSSGLSRYANQKPPLQSINTIANGITGSINRNEKVLKTYISNWSTILGPTQKAHDALAALISYTPPKNITSTSTVSNSNSQFTYSTSEYAACVKDFKSLQPVASASQASVQKILTRGKLVTSKANAALKKFEVVQKEVNTALKTKTLAAITKATDDYQNITRSDGLMPSGTNIEYASTQSVSIPTTKGGGGVNSSGIDKLTVTGSTIVSRMPVLSTNATKALAKTKTCFANSVVPLFN